MAPPDRDDQPRHGNYVGYLQDANLWDNPRLGHNVQRLGSWLEWLLHPEEHEYDREVQTPHSGGPEWREERGPIEYNYGGPGNPEKAEYPSRSVLHEHWFSHFFDPLVAVSTQRVETGESLLATATANMHNIYWAGDEFTHELSNFPVEWKGDAAVEAERFVRRLESVAGQLNKVALEFIQLVPKYALIIKATRENLNQAAAELVEAFEHKFATKPENSFSLDILGIALAVIAAGAVTYMSGGPGAVIGKELVLAAWSATFTQASTELLKPGEKGKIDGYLWKELAASYLANVDNILKEAKVEIDNLTAKITQLATNFESHVPEFEDKLPQRDKLPK